MIDPTMPCEESVRSFVEQIGDPYCYLDNGVVVEVGYADTDDSLQDGILDRDEYSKMRAKYSAMIGDLEKELQQLQVSRDEALENAKADEGWITQHVKFRELSELSRGAVVAALSA